ncbi:MAG: DUF1707 domain-containing protein [Actinomycetia bacterium]|nr:DUF1707 domain-containing protein [Actinomycetes bacterium]MCP4085876.1 DUF1707 domain-containing protein [Actinomycetes bacterium]
MDGVPQRQDDHIRLSDAERREVIARLQEATDEGRLTILEFEDRVGLVWEARTRGDLAGIDDDLPFRALPARIPPDHVLTPAEARRQWIISMLGGTRRKGSWKPGSPTMAVAVLGAVDLDLSDVEDDIVEIVAISLFGGVEVKVPAGTQVEMGGFALLGGNRDRTDPVEGGPPLRVRIRSFAFAGGCNVRNRRFRFRRLRRQVR